MARIGTHALGIAVWIAVGASVGRAQAPPPATPAPQAPAEPAPPAAPSERAVPSPAAPPAAQPPAEQPPAAPPPAEQAPAAPPPVPKTGLAPPRLIEFKQARYPDEAFAQGIAGQVLIELVVGVDGKVKEAKVVEAAGHGFDAAALAAVKQFVFAPATKDGQPIVARIRYPYVFEVRAEAPPEPETPPPGRLQGLALSQDDDPLVGYAVTIENENKTVTLDTTTDDEGRFAYDELEPGLYYVRVIGGEDYEDAEQREWIKPDKLTELTMRLFEPFDPEAFGAVARIPAPPREVTRRSLGKAQVTRIPGTRGDALRTVELMPGVARPPLGAGVLIVRGSAPGDSQTLLEGLPVQLLYHFGGLTSFINSRLLEGIEFYPGNFSVRYGRRRGGIIEVRVADPPNDALHGVADVNFIDASLLVQGPISEDAEIAVAARRSYFDVLFEGVTDALSDDVSTIAAPVYYDYQAIANYRPTDDDKLRLMVYGSSDEFALLFSEPSDTDSAISGDLDFGTEFHRAHGSWRRRLGKDVDQDIDLAIGAVDVDFGLGDAFDFNLSGNDIYGRAEWRGRVTDQVRLIGGLDVALFPGTFTYTGPPVQQTEGNPNQGGNATALSNQDQITASDDFYLVQPAVYLETDLSLEPVRVTVGSRVDYFEEIDEYTFDPRLAGHYALGETTTLRGGVGMFSQPPQFQESSPVLGNPNLEPTRTLHVGTGIDQEIDEGITVGLDGFYKHLYDRVVGTPTGQAPYLINDGVGRIYGMELAVKVMPRGRFFGYLSYTLSRSERRDRGSGWRLFDFDQPHILTVAGIYRLGNGWEAGATFRLVSGNPDTPIQGASENLSTGLFSPAYGALNSIRSPAFHRLDLRVEKQWKFSAWKLALYLDLQNAYNRANSEGLACDFEYRECTQIRGLPIIPNLGLRGEM
jgi:TonB family protein